MECVGCGRVLAQEDVRCAACGREMKLQWVPPPAEPPPFDEEAERRLHLVWLESQIFDDGADEAGSPASRRSAASELLGDDVSAHQEAPRAHFEPGASAVEPGGSILGALPHLVMDEAPGTAGTRPR